MKEWSIVIRCIRFYSTPVRQSFGQGFGSTELETINADRSTSALQSAAIFNSHVDIRLLDSFFAEWFTRVLASMSRTGSKRWCRQSSTSTVTWLLFPNFSSYLVERICSNICRFRQMFNLLIFLGRVVVIQSIHLRLPTPMQYTQSTHLFSIQESLRTYVHQKSCCSL